VLLLLLLLLFELLVLLVALLPLPLVLPLALVLPLTPDPSQARDLDSSRRRPGWGLIFTGLPGGA